MSAAAAVASTTRGHANETWTARVLKARGVTSSTPPAEQARLHSRFMKRLRAKACKLRKRLAESSVASPDVGAYVGGDDKLLAKCSELHEVCKTTLGHWPVDQQLPVESLSSAPPVLACLEIAFCEYRRAAARLFSSRSKRRGAIAMARSQELRAATLRQHPKDVLRAVRQVGDQALASASKNAPVTTAELLQPAYPPGDTTPAPCMYAPDATFPGAARRCGLVKAVATAAAATPPWPTDVQHATLSVLAALLTDTDNVAFLLATPHALFLIEQLQAELTAALSAPSPSPSASPDLAALSAASGLPATSLLEAYLSLCVTLFSYTPDDTALQSRRCDLVSYALACGIVYRIAELFSLLDRTHGGAAPVPPCVQHCLLLLQAVAAGHAPLADTLAADALEPSTPPEDAALTQRHDLRCRLQVRAGARRSPDSGERVHCA